MIIYGWNSFKLDGCKPSTLGMSPELDKQYAIERRQKYFHLFWIPFFGIGKIWVLRNLLDNKLYEPSNEVRSILNSLPVNHKTPWYTFSLFFLVLAAGLIFVIGEKAGEYSRKRSYERSIVEKNENFQKALKDPAPGTYFKMKSGRQNIYLKVIGNTPELIVCLLSDKKSSTYSQYEYLEAFLTDSMYKSFDTVKVAKLDLEKTFNKTDAYPFQGFEAIKGSGSMVFEELITNALPVFKSLGAGYEDGKFFAVVQNIGESAKFKGFTQETTGLKLGSPSFPEEFKNGAYIFLKGSYEEAEPKMKATVKFESNANTITEYNLSIRGTYLSFKQVNQ